MSLTTTVVKYDLFSFISNNFAAACHSVLKLLQLSSNWFTELFSKLRNWWAQFVSTLLFHTTRLAMLICRCVVELFDTCRVHHTSVARIKQQWPIEMFVMFIQNKLQLCIQHVTMAVVLDNCCCHMRFAKGEGPSPMGRSPRRRSPVRLVEQMIHFSWRNRQHFWILNIWCCIFVHTNCRRKARARSTAHFCLNDRLNFVGSKIPG